MATSPITGVPLPNTTSTDQVPTDLMAAFTAAEKMWVGSFASASARDTKITAPVGGMVAWLASPGKFVYYDTTAAAWLDMFNPTAWLTWTPTLQDANGVAFNLGGNATQIGRYQRLGKSVSFQCQWTFGSSVSGPGGPLVFQLPPALPAANIAGLGQTGLCSLYVPNTNDNYMGFWTVNPGESVGRPHFTVNKTNNNAMTFLRDTTDGTTAATGVPQITGTTFDYPIQINGALTASGTYQIA